MVRKRRDRASTAFASMARAFAQMRRSLAQATRGGRRSLADVLHVDRRRTTQAEEPPGERTVSAPRAGSGAQPRAEGAAQPDASGAELAALRRDVAVALAKAESAEQELAARRRHAAAQAAAGATRDA